MEVFNREKWLKEDCVFTNNEGCAACPYVVSDETGYFKCDKKMYEKCMKELDEPEPLPSFEEFKELRADNGGWAEWSQPLYICPKCGGKVRQYLGVVLTSYPPKHRYECSNKDCDYFEIM